MIVEIVSANERSYFDEISKRSFFAYRPTCGYNKIWQIEEIDQKNVQGSHRLKLWGQLFKTRYIEGYIKALVEHTQRPVS